MSTPPLSIPSPFFVVSCPAMFLGTQLLVVSYYGMSMIGTQLEE
jgi:hypothetical protein